MGKKSKPWYIHKADGNRFLESYSKFGPTTEVTFDKLGEDKFS